MEGEVEMMIWEKRMVRKGVESEYGERMRRSMRKKMKNKIM